MMLARRLQWEHGEWVNDKLKVGDSLLCYRCSTKLAAELTPVGQDSLPIAMWCGPLEDTATARRSMLEEKQ